jgi:hypothetical protein
MNSGGFVGELCKILQIFAGVKVAEGSTGVIIQ